MNIVTFDGLRRIAGHFRFLKRRVARLEDLQEGDREDLNDLKNYRDGIEASPDFSHDADTDALVLSASARRACLIARAEAAGAVYNAETGFFELNGLIDLTDADMLKTLEAGRLNPYYPNGRFRGYDIRTDLPGFDLGSIGCGANVYYGSRVEVAAPGPGFGGGAIAYGMCSKLHTINPGGVVRIAVDATNMFTGCVALRNANFQIYGNCNLNIADSPLITCASLKYAVDNSKHTAPITITVHPDVYAKIEAAQNGEVARADWAELVRAANAKNISFVTVTQ